MQEEPANTTASLSFARTRSNSESQSRSTRAEKRMGRLFKQPMASKPQVQPQQVTPSSQTSSPDDLLHRSRTLPSANQTPLQTHSAHSSNSTTNGYSTASTPLTAISGIHSNSSSTSSNVSSVSVTSPTSQSQIQAAQRPQLPRKLSVGSHPVAMKFTTIKTTAVATSALATTQKPASIHPSNTSNASSPSLTPSSAATNSTSIPVTSSSVPLPPLPLASLLTAARKFRFIYRECIALIRRLDLDRTVSLHLGAYPAFSTVLEAVERKVAAKEPTGPQLQFSLCTSLVDSITDLRALIGGLEPSRSALDSIDPESLRLAYFSLYSLLVEAVGLCRTLTPQPVRFRRRPSQLAQQQKLLQSPPQQHSQVLKGSPFSALARSKSQQIRSTASAAMLGRAPPPNPQHASQTAAIPSRQSSLSGGPLKRPPLKIDTTVSGVRRQDSELSVGSILIEAAGSSTALNSANPTSSSTMTLTDDEKLYEIIGYTIQESQVVFSQLNTAISKSAINTARDTEEGGEMNSGTNASSSNNGSPDLNHVAQKIKEMTLHCVASMEETKRIKATLMASRSVEQLDEDEQKRLYEETSLFLKSIINILAATKGAIQDIPALNEVRGALSNLTRATKELTIRLETSALKQAVISNSSSSTNLVEQPPLSSIPSVANFQPSGTSHTNTSPTRGTSSILSPVSLAKKTKIDLKDGITMQQYIQDLKAANSGHNEWSPMQTPVTTPLVASIGPAAASAVLPSAGSSHDLEHNPFDKMGKR